MVTLTTTDAFYAYHKLKNVQRQLSDVRGASLDEARRMLERGDIGEYAYAVHLHDWLTGAARVAHGPCRCGCCRQAANSHQC